MILTSSSQDIEPDAEIFDNENKIPLIPNYVDMLAAQGNDGEADQIPPAYETAYSPIQSKKNGIRRKNFQDTDNNAEDAEAVSYENADVSLIFPHSTADGDWYSENLKAQAEAVKRKLPVSYAAYCTDDTIEKIAALTAKVDEALNNNDAEKLSELSNEASKLKIEFNHDEKVAQFYIDTIDKNGISLDKKVGYVYAQLTCVSTDGSIMASDLSFASQIKTRGNSTASGKKRPYNVKFKDKTNLFGLGAAKKWVLLADMYDPTLMRNWTALTLGKKLGLEGTMDCRRVEVWVDGQYRGLYLLTEKIEDNVNRVDVNTDDGDFIVELDEYAKSETDIVKFTSSLGKPFRIHEPEKEFEVERVKTTVDNFEKLLTFGEWDKIKDNIDIDSFVAYYIVNEFMRNVDSSWKSVYFHYKDNKFYGGPLWDFDWSSANTNSTANPVGASVQSYHYYKYLTPIPEFRLAIFKKLVEADNAGFFEATYKSGGWIENQAEFYADAIKRNYTNLWTYRCASRTAEPTYEANLKVFTDWLEGRHKWFQNYFFNKVHDSATEIYYYDYLKDLAAEAGIIDFGVEKYYISEGGRIGKGHADFISYEDEYYYIDENGKITTGIINIDGNKYNTDGNGKILPQYLDVEIDGKNLLRLDAGETGSITFTASVSENYGAGLSTKALSEGDYSLSWNSNAEDFESSGILFNDGILSINEASKVGIYDISVTCKASAGSIEGESEVNVKIIVNNVEAVLSPDTVIIEAQKGLEIERVTINAEQGQDIIWSIEGVLPDGLNFAAYEDYVEITGKPERGTSGFYECVVVASNDMGFDAADIFVTVTGSAEDEITSDDNGVLIYEGNIFRNAGSEIMASVDIVIDSEAKSFSGVTGQSFAKNFAVDSEIYIADTDYDSYIFSLDISGLPGWLKASGELTSSDVFTYDGEDGSTKKYHHVFTLSGTPTQAGNEVFTLNAMVKISGDIPVLVSYASFDVAVSITTPPPSPAPAPTPAQEDSTHDEPSELEEPAESEEPEKPETPEKPEEQPVHDEPEEPAPEEPTPEIPEHPEPEEPVHEEPQPSEVQPIHEEPAAPEKPASEEPSGPKPEQPSYVEPEKPNQPEHEEPQQIEQPEQPEQNEPESPEKPVIDPEISELVQEIENMTETERQNVKAIEITGNIENINEIISMLENLEQLDLTNAESENINLSNNSSIKDIKISGNESIKRIILTDSNIENLNAEECTNLEVLEANGCSISKINLNGCISLSKINLDHNSLAAFDASIFENLQELSCTGQNLSGWKVGKNFSFASYIVSVAAADDSDENFSGFAPENITNIKAYDRAGREIQADYDSETGDAEFSESPYKLTYEYITGFNNINMDVTVYPDTSDITEPESPSPESYSDSDFGSSSGGCNSGFVFGALICITAFRKRRA